jgi:hypothetical protein
MLLLMLHCTMESLMEVLILVCALGVSAPDCQKGSSIAQFYAPDPQESLSGCMRHGMLYAAQSRLVTPGTYSKIVCVPHSRKAIGSNATKHVAG